MHGCCRITIDPRIPIMPGRTTSDFHRPGRHCFDQARSAVRCSASSLKGELHPTKSRLRGGLSCIWMTASNGGHVASFHLTRRWMTVLLSRCRGLLGLVTHGEKAPPDPSVRLNEVLWCGRDGTLGECISCTHVMRAGGGLGR